MLPWLPDWSFPSSAHFSRPAIIIIIIYKINPIHRFYNWHIPLAHSPTKHAQSNTPVHLIESVGNDALCMRQCLLSSSNMSVTHSALAFTRANRQGLSQPHSPGRARVPLSSFVPQISINFFLFFLKLYIFSSSFWPSGWASRPPGKALATPLRIVLTPAPSIKLRAIASYRLLHSHAQVVSFTDSMM